MNDSLSLLLTRQSTPRLCSPAPNSDEISTIINAGMRVPDHACLTPWHFTVIQDDGLHKLSEVFVEAIKNNTHDEAKLEKTAKMPFRAPLIIVVSTKYQVHEKVPEKEQLIAAGCTCHAMQMACVALGYGAVWRTGELSESAVVKSALNVEMNNDIVGFLYIGSHIKQQVPKPRKLADDHVSYF
ncbi:NAD(P)H nitroreductase [Thalassotalea profundi]|uniref:Putative NAD(P)H nitroreductase n=1 Tax=Thalassotalea profundi TaxID=2036687 RepID=A0ABQ3IHJ6_9GAMM|nr:NAD(P)H nitroreductase [Thalassotalea profundi]GHE82692.1 nitroreductase [Thalassotalea profundi]